MCILSLPVYLAPGILYKIIVCQLFFGKLRKEKVFLKRKTWVIRPGKRISATCWGKNLASSI
jgi:hypothetical protein